MPLDAFAQTAYGGGEGGAPKPQPQAGQTDTGGDPSNADNMGSTGWSGSWTGNEGTQNDAPATPTTDRTKPLPPVPPTEGDPP